MCLFQIVDSISDAPEVLLDLNEAFGVAEGSSFTPPSVRRSNSWTSLADGSTEHGTTWADREIALTLDGTHGTAEQQVADLQKLGRLLSSPQWLKVLPCGMAHPVFFRTRRAESRVIEIFMTESPQRGLDVSLPADPFAYGLPESGTVTITNHPFSGTNRMCAVLEPAKGDVPAPLVLDFLTPALYPQPNAVTVARFRSLVASWSSRTGTPPASILSAAPSSSGSGATVTVTTATDSTMASGTRYRLVPTASAGFRTMPFAFDVPEPGDYRVFLRARASGLGAANPATVTVLGQTTTIRRPSSFPSPAPEYFDLGVTRLPQMSVSTGDAFGLSPDSTSVRIDMLVQFIGSTGQLDIDCLVFVPADVGATLGSQSTSSLEQSIPRFSSDVRLTLDGVNDVRYASWEATGGYGDRAWHVGDMDGALPVAHPAQSTQLALMPVVALESAGYVGEATEFPEQMEIGDPLGTDTVVNWQYFPRYLYLRGIE